MATKESATNTARRNSSLYEPRGRPMFIYRVGKEWMFTSRDEKTVQDRYRVKIKDFQQVC